MLLLAHVPDLGQLPECDDGTLPHNRLGWVTSIASSGSSSLYAGMFMFVDLPTVAFTAYDAEDAAEPAGSAFEVVTLGPPPFE